MGVRGLTTYINNRSHLFLEDYKLHDTKLILDGNSIAAQLYKWHCRSNDCFGGDYDKYAHVIVHFFNLLSQCNIVPYVIFDGGYERKKLATVIGRMKNKIRTASQLNCVTEGSESVFPLFLRETFIDVLLKLNVKVARCEFEGDTEIANVAKLLNCPVLSYDSDFYIFGCLYIPFSTVDLNLRKSKTGKYISCKIYKVETFLDAFGGLDKNNLPILAVLLGNDYVKRSLFGPFFRNLKIQKCHGNQNDQQKRIKSVIVWLQNETLESAIATVLNRFKTRRRKMVIQKIQNAMSCYHSLNMELLKYIGINTTRNDQEIKINFDEIENNLTDCPDDSEESDVESDSDGEELISDTECSDKGDNKGSKVFKENFRKCLYPSCFMDMVVLNKYYCVPQVEDSDSEHSHTISVDLISAIYKILTDPLKKKLLIVARCGKNNIKFHSIPKCTIELPSLEEIQFLTESARKQHFLNLLQVGDEFIKSLESFPIEWHLFLISLKYAFSRAKFDLPLLHSLILCFIVLNYVDSKIGFHRSTKSFEKKVFSIPTNVEDSQAPFVISTKDCVNCMQKLVSYFQMDAKSKTNYKSFDNLLVHSLSQIQSCFLHIKYLNSLFEFPYPNLTIHTIFDGTFLYNMTTNLRKRSNSENYLTMLLGDSPTLVSTFGYVLSTISQFFNCATGQSVGKRNKKRRKKKTEPVVEEPREIKEEHDNVLDPNNFFSVLSIV